MDAHICKIHILLKGWKFTTKSSRFWPCSRASGQAGQKFHDGPAQTTYWTTMNDLGEGDGLRRWSIPMELSDWLFAWLTGCMGWLFDWCDGHFHCRCHCRWWIDLLKVWFAQFDWIKIRWIPLISMVCLVISDSNEFNHNRCQALL